MTTCQICGLDYDRRDPAQREAHRRLHQRPTRRPRRLESLRPLRTHGCRILHDGGPFDYVHAVSARSYVWARLHAEAVGMRAKYDTGWMLRPFHATDLPTLDRVHVLLRVLGSEYVGFLRIQRAQRVAAVDLSGVERLDCLPAGTRPRRASWTWAASHVWVAPEHRRQGVATELLDVAGEVIGPRRRLLYAPPFSADAVQMIRCLESDRLDVAVL